jgi:hypothetical protein
MRSDGMTIGWVYETHGYGVVVETDCYGTVLVPVAKYRSVARAVLATLASPATVGSPITEGAESYDDDRRGDRSWEPIGSVKRLGRRGFTVVIA